MTSHLHYILKTLKQEFTLLGLAYIQFIILKSQISDIVEVKINCVDLCITTDTQTCTCTSSIQSTYICL